MKKIYSILAFVLLITLVGCNSDDSSTNDTESKDTLKVGMDLSYPPFETTDENGDPYGVSVDIANELGKYLDRDVEIVNVPFASLIPALETGEIDIIIGSMSITDERKKKVSFSNPYNYFKIIGLANNEYLEENSYDENTSWDDIFANKDTEFVGLVSQISAQIPTEKGFDIQEATDISTAVLEVSQGKSDILIMSAEPVVNSQAANDKTTTVLWDTITSSPIGMAVAKGNEDILDDVNEFIAQMESSGFNDILRDKYDDQVSGQDGYNYYLNEE